MAVTQTRTYELGLFDGISKPLPEVMIEVDHADWSRPKRFPLAGFTLGEGGEIIISNHIEKDIVGGLTDHFVEITFTTPFDSVPVGRGNLYVYKEIDLGGGKSSDQDVPIYNLQVTASGFSFNIEDTEDLTGIYFEYLFM